MSLVVLQIGNRTAEVPITILVARSGFFRECLKDPATHEFQCLQMGEPIPLRIPCQATEGVLHAFLSALSYPLDDWNRICSTLDRSELMCMWQWADDYDVPTLKGAIIECVVHNMLPQEAISFIARVQPEDTLEDVWVLAQASGAEELQRYVEGLMSQDF